MLDRDDRRRIAAAAILPVIGGAAFIIQPGFVQGLVTEKGFSEQQAGFLASAEVAGFAVSAVLLAMLAKRLAWHPSLYGALALCGLANAISGFVADATVFGIVRFFAGLGAGTILAIGWTTLGETSHPDRNFGINLVMTLSFAAIVLLFMPEIYAGIGFKGLVLALAALAFAGLPLVPQMPVRAPIHIEGMPAAALRPLIVRLSAQGAVACYFLGIGGIWAYLALIGTAGGISESEVATGLAAAQIGGLAGAFLPVAAGNRFGRVPFLALAALTSAAPLVYFALWPLSAQGYLAAASFINFGFNVAQVYLLALLAGLGDKTREITTGNAVQWTATAIAPSVAALLIAHGSYNPVLWLATGLFILFFLLTLPAART